MILENNNVTKNYSYDYNDKENQWKPAHGSTVHRTANTVHLL